MNINRICIFSLLLFLCGRLSAQEQLIRLQQNPRLAKETTGFRQKSLNAAEATPLLLPFTEDFSKENIYPDTARWTDRNAFVNRSFCVRPPSIGVATLDAVDACGRIYPQGKTTAFPADTLTSRPIRLDSIFSPIARSLTAADSVYFSFFYQPGGGLQDHPWEGLGDAPEGTDSLLLDFGYFTGDSVLSEDSLSYLPEIRWIPVWSEGGMNLETFIKTYHLDSTVYFRQVMIPVTDSCFFNGRFQFRFRNLASLEFTADNPTWAGNVDFWNIDYIRLDRGRSYKDTFIDDIVIAENPGGLLQHYEAMPWNQFRTSELKSAFQVHLANLSNTTKNASYQFSVTNPEGQQVGSYDGGSYNIEYFRRSGYQSYAPHARPSLGSVQLASNADTVDFRITHIHKEAGSGDMNPDNDTAVFIQKFRNYYAYDDGTPEAGYTVIDIDTKHTALALKFKLNTPDTLRAVGMYINHVLDDANAFDFTLCVWNDRNDMPGECVYSQKVSQDSLLKLYELQLFYLDRPQFVSGSFYVGYELNGKNFLNVGFDQNTDHSTDVRYFSGNKWHTSFLCGTPMLRPFLGAAWSPLSVTDNAPTDKPDIYPNPASGRIQLRLPEGMETSRTEVEIFSMTGQRMYKGLYTESISVASWPSGMYFLRAQDNGHCCTGKFTVR